MRYTIIVHEVREQFDLTISEYLVADSIEKLSRRGPTKRSKRDIASFLGISKTSVSDSIHALLKKGILELSEKGLISTEKWLLAVHQIAPEGEESVRNPDKSVRKTDKTSEIRTDTTIINVIKGNRAAEPRTEEEEKKYDRVPLNKDSEVAEKRIDPRFSNKAREVYDSFIHWAEEERGFPFLKTTYTKQYSALKLAKQNNLKGSDLRDRWREMMVDKYWSERGFDWMDVVLSFNKKGV